MSNRPMDESYIWHLAEGERFSRSREFARVQRVLDGEFVDKWWLGRPSDYALEEGVRVVRVAEGREFVEVIEVVATGTLGKIAIFRQWIIDPDGAECATPWAPRRSRMLLRRESTLRGTLNGGDYFLDERREREQPKPTKPKAKAKLRIIASQARVH